MTAPRQVKCPRCGKPALFTPENPNRPFCSDRCKLIDLGEWAEGKYAIPVESASQAGSEDLAELVDEEIDGGENSADDSPFGDRNH